MFFTVVLIILLLIGIGMIVGHWGLVGGRRVVGESTKRWSATCCQGTRHNNPTTFSYIPAHSHTKPPSHFPTFPHTFSYAFSVLSRAVRTACTRAPWAGKGALCCRCGEPGNPTPVCVSHNPTQFCLHNPSPICMSRNPTALPQSYISLQFPSNLAKLAEKPLFSWK